MRDKFFLDTNIFIYAFDKNNPDKKNRANALIKDGLSSQKACISYQVVQEFLNVAFQKFEKPLTIADCQQYLNTILEPLCEVYAGIGLYVLALEIAEGWRYSFYDSLIIAAASTAKCKILYSEDLQHGQKIGDLEIQNPFL